MDRELFLPYVSNLLPDDYLARFVVEVVGHLDPLELTQQYAGQGSKAHHPVIPLSLLIYRYATVVFSSREIERAAYNSIAFRYVAANTGSI